MQNFPEFLNFLAGLWKIWNKIWTGYNGGIEGGATRGRKIFKKFIEIEHVKFLKIINFQNFHDFLLRFGKKYKNWKFYLSSWFVLPPDSEILWCFPNFSSCHFNFPPKFAGRPPRYKLIIHYSEYKWVRGAKPPTQGQTKF